MASYKETSIKASSVRRILYLNNFNGSKFFLRELREWVPWLVMPLDKEFQRRYPTMIAPHWLKKIWFPSGKVRAESTKCNAIQFFPMETTWVLWLPVDGILWGDVHKHEGIIHFACSILVFLGIDDTKAITQKAGQVSPLEMTQFQWISTDNSLWWIFHKGVQCLTFW